MPRQSLGATLKKVWLPGTILIVGAAFVGGYFAFAGGSSHHAAPVVAAAPAPAAVAAVVPAAPVAPAPADPAPVAAAAIVPPADPAPIAAAPVAAAPAIVEPAAPAAVAHIVNVRFDSQPAGATVMLVDGGKTSFLGTAPVDASVDTSRAYDVVFTLDGHPTQVQHLDANATQHVTGLLAGPPAAPQVAVAPIAPAPIAPAPVHHHHVAAVAPLEPLEPAPVSHRAAAAGGQGVLMVSSKPPCEISIDGRATGLTTPQRSIALAAGSHKVTLTNAADHLSKTVNVTISADQPTKLIQNLLK